MIKLTILRIVGMVFLAELIESCDDTLIRTMAISACSLNKKRSSSIDNNLSVIGLTPFLGDIEQQYKELIDGIDESEALLLTKSDKKESKKEPATTVRNRPIYLPMFRNPLYRKTTTRSPKPYNFDVKMSTVKKRDDISALVQECCKRSCTIDDFRIICGKK